MNPFFKNLGRAVADQWKQANFSLEAFPEMAVRLLEENPPSEGVDMEELLRDFLMNDEQPFQTQSGFGQPEMVVYDDPRFYIQVLFWLDGTTDIHQHEFSGAFHVMVGSSIHAHFDFEDVRPVTPHFQVGNLRRTSMELLETGRTVPIRSGKTCIHSLFHLDLPSVTVVVRTQNDPGTSPQFTYLPPHVALDPVQNDALTMRRKQVLDVLEQVEDPGYAEMVLEMIEELDLERGFSILQNAMGALKDLGLWEEILQAYGKKHGVLTSGIEATLEECVRRDVIKDLRRTITDPDHRFFLALLMNGCTRTDLLQLVAQRYEAVDPVETILTWLAELTEPTGEGLLLMDVCFASGEGDTLEVVLSVVRQMLLGQPVELASAGLALGNEILATLRRSCLHRALMT